MVSLLLDLLVFENDELLDCKHFFAVALDGHKFVVGLGHLDVIEDLENIVVLVLNLDEAQLLLLVLSNEADQLAALLNLV